LLLLPACSFLSPSEKPDTYGYTLTWHCISSKGCERSEEVTRIDRVIKKGYDFHFTSTLDESFGEDALMILSDSLGFGCDWLYDLSLFGHDLERSRLCFNPGGFELELSIPNEDPATSSQWVVAAQDLDLF
jgi:hypothetical protein